MKKMIKQFAVLVVLSTLAVINVSAQAYKEGDKILNAGFGLGSTFLSSGLKSSVPPVGFSFEVATKHKNISLGGYAGYSSASYNSYSYKWKYTYLIVGARGSYHFATTEKLDPYAGVLLGYNIASVKEPSDYEGTTRFSAGGLVYGFHLGARYFFTDKIGAFGELGYGVAWLNFGITAKF